jgi:uncharacterized protein with FMN-binding domain
MEPAQTNSKKKIIAGLVVLVAIALLALGAKALTAKDNAPQATAPVASDTTSTPQENDTSSTDDTQGSSADAAGYKDGTYTATGNYTSPGGNESIGLSVTLKDGAITNSTVTEGASDPEAREYQQDFIGSYKSFVTGKNIDDIKLSRVSGSSLTSNGFNRALDQIKQQAKS